MSAHGNIFTFSTFSGQLASSERKWALYCLISEGPVKQATFKSEIEADYSGATSVWNEKPFLPYTWHSLHKECDCVPADIFNLLRKLLGGTWRQTESGL